jgi:hypothetical protein
VGTPCVRQPDAEESGAERAARYGFGVSDDVRRHFDAFARACVAEYLLTATFARFHRALVVRAQPRAFAARARDAPTRATRASTTHVHEIARARVRDTPRAMSTHSVARTRHCDHDPPCVRASRVR